MSYQVLARKSRPTQFEELFGQEHVTLTLKNAIKAGRIAHAYLFSGPRGVGKTSAARLLAKAMNCVQGPTESPCGSCSFCREINEGTSMDVIEVDAASHTGVEHIRSLTETIKYHSSGNKYKIYLIDEVHMLSISAFNALLKNLEEPPPRVIFIFATTEVHKVPETIQSRCQHFIFNLIPQPLIMEKLKRLIAKEEVVADDKVISIIARASGGSMRDAESILEKIMTYCGNPITEDKCLRALGLVPSEILYQLCEHIVHERVQDCFACIGTIISEGRNLNKFIQDLIDFFRHILLFKVSRETALPSHLQEAEKDRFRILAQQFRESQLLFIMDTLVKLEIEIKYSPSPLILAEMALLKLSRSRQVLPIDEVIKKIRVLEDRLSSQYHSPPSTPAISVKNESTEEDISRHSISKGLNAETIKNRWGDFLLFLEKKNSLIKTYLSEAKISKFDGNQLNLTFSEGSVFVAKIIHDPDMHKKVAQELAHFFHHQMVIKIEVETTPLLEEEKKNHPQAHEQNDDASYISPQESIRKLIHTNAFVEKTMELFQGNVVNYKPASVPETKKRSQNEQIE
ncbi:MAG: DNA polymerase III subunit gamma/tau [Candidatus Aureabacteria bacterium]|nr:DNA polymerase III subunit gamma/tau [Candidatus Auribacterota bacterium]